MQLPKRLTWLRSGLFWRTFVLLGMLITISMMVWYTSSRTLERTPRARQIAAQVISIVKITEAALTHSAPESRHALLTDLKDEQGIRIYPLEPNDIVEAIDTDSVITAVLSNVRQRLGQDTTIAKSVNGRDGFWVSFNIEGDRYWLVLDRERIEHNNSIEWLGWAGFTLFLSLTGAVFISRLINLPLARLTDAASAVARGQLPPPLPESGPAEIREANRSFNQMVGDLSRIESDRTLVLAGISHDLRTPLARMLLEVEMANLTDDSRIGMQSDLAQMDAIIGQFIDFSKPSDTVNFIKIDLSQVLHDCVQTAQRMPDVRITDRIDGHLEIIGHAIELRRVFTNLVENARRYGKTEMSGIVEIEISARVVGERVVVRFRDHGAGVPEAEIERLLRPFVRLDSARGQANGAGLGLAIVDRIIRRHGGKLRLRNSSTGGLVVEIAFPKA